MYSLQVYYVHINSFTKYNRHKKYINIFPYMFIVYAAHIRNSTLCVTHTYICTYNKILYVRDMSGFLFIFRHYFI